MVAAITNAARESSVPKACNAEPSARTTSNCAAISPPKSWTTLIGCVANDQVLPRGADVNRERSNESFA